MRNINRVSNSLDLYQADIFLHFIEPDLGPNCFQRLSADNTGRERIKVFWQEEMTAKFISYIF